MELACFIMASFLTTAAIFILVRATARGAYKQGYDNGYRHGTYDASKMHVDTERFFRGIAK